MDPDDEKIALGRTRSTKSISSKILEDRKEKAATKYSLWTLIKFMASFNLKEWWIMCIGCVFTCIAGAGQPVQGIFFAKSIVALAQPLVLADKIR
ncbi:MAG: GTPase-activating protein, partial [Watsoniomyces obsoletus]